MNKAKKVIAKSALSLIFLISLNVAASPDTTIHPNDIAKFISGLEPGVSSPLYNLTKSKNWQRHSKAFDSAWDRVEAAKLKEARIWTKKTFTKSEDTMFYMFSGPDYLYADTFFPNAKTYILTGLEPVGRVSNIGKLPTRTLNYSLVQLRQSLNTVLSYSFFITKRMKSELRTGFQGTLPIILVFMARTGKKIHDISYVTLKKDGTLEPFVAENSRQTPAAVKITFNRSGGEMQTLYYFSTDLANYGVRRSGFLKYCEKLGRGDSLVKSASYLMHLSSFSAVRDFLLKNSSTILQDDSGIPIRHFARDQWGLHLHGRYYGPISLFAKHYQRDLQRLYRKSKPERVKFGIGYRWRTHETNFLLARKKI